MARDDYRTIALPKAVWKMLARIVAETHEHKTAALARLVRAEAERLNISERTNDEQQP